MSECSSLQECEMPSVFIRYHPQGFGVDSHALRHRQLGASCLQNIKTKKIQTAASGKVSE